MNTKTPDPEMLKELELLENWDSLQAESDWESLANMEGLEQLKDQDEIEEGDK